MFWALQSSHIGGSFLDAVCFLPVGIALWSRMIIRNDASKLMRQEGISRIYITDPAWLLISHKYAHSYHFSTQILNRRLSIFGDPLLIGVLYLPQWLTWKRCIILRCYQWHCLFPLYLSNCHVAWFTYCNFQFQKASWHDIWKDDWCHVCILGALHAFRLDDSTKELSSIFLPRELLLLKRLLGLRCHLYQLSTIAMILFSQLQWLNVCLSLSNTVC